MQGMASGTEAAGQDSLVLTRRLLDIALNDVWYVRGIFPECNFMDRYIQEIDKTVKKLTPVKMMSEILLNWMEKGVYDALEKKSLKCLSFIICDTDGRMVCEEYKFEFGYSNSNSVEVNLHMSYSTGTNRMRCTTTVAEVNANNMINSICKVIKAIHSNTECLDSVPEEASIQMKLLYYDDMPHENYEPDFVKDYTDIWNKQFFKIEMGGVNGKCAVLTFKVPSEVNLSSSTNVHEIRDDSRMDCLHSIRAAHTEPGPSDMQHDMSMKRCEESVNNISPVMFGGYPVFNTVTWRLNGTPRIVHDGYRACMGHKRLWNILKGKVLDVSKIWGPGKFLYTTASDGTFRFTVTYDDEDTGETYWVTMVIDGREGWNYGYFNPNGHFEYKSTQPLRYMTCSDWSELSFVGCYDDIAPDGHTKMQLDIDVVKRSCKVMSQYNGEDPAPLEVQVACGVMVNYLCEGYKFHPAFELNCRSLLISGQFMDPVVSKMVKKWMKLGKESLHNSLMRLYSNDPHGAYKASLPKIPGITSVEDALECLSILPFNAIPRPPKESRARTWQWSPLDAGALEYGGEPHHSSSLFTGRWPYSQQLINELPSKNFIEISEVAKYAHRFKQNQASKFPVVKSRQAPTVANVEKLMPLAARMAHKLKRGLVNVPMLFRVLK